MLRGKGRPALATKTMLCEEQAFAIASAEAE